MATRSNIALKLREEDRNKTFTTPWGEEVKPNGNGYLQIYCHWDGYPSGVGKDLEDKSFTYEDALGFMLEGDHSTVDTSYWHKGGEKCPAHPMENPSLYEEYLYVMEEIDGVLTVYLLEDGVKYTIDEAIVKFG